MTAQVVRFFKKQMGTRKKEMALWALVLIIGLITTSGIDPASGPGIPLALLTMALVLLSITTISSLMDPRNENKRKKEPLLSELVQQRGKRGLPVLVFLIFLGPVILFRFFFDKPEILRFFLLAFSAYVGLLLTEFVCRRK